MLKIQPVMAQQTSFQGKREGKLEKFERIAEKVDSFGDEELTAEEKADMLKELSKEEGMPKFLKFFLSALGIGGAGFLGGKVATGKLVKLADNNLKVMDSVGEMASKAVSNLTDKIEAKDGEKGVKAILANGAHKFAGWFNNLGKKGLKDLETASAADVAKNAVKKLTSTAGGVVGASLAVGDASQDKDEDGVPKVFDRDDGEKSGSFTNKAQNFGNAVGAVLDMAS